MTTLQFMYAFLPMDPWVYEFNKSTFMQLDDGVYYYNGSLNGYMGVPMFEVFLLQGVTGGALTSHSPGLNGCS